MFGFGGFDFGKGGGFFDQWEDDEDLSTALQFLSSEAEDGFACVARRGDFGDDREAIFRKLVEDGDVEIAEIGDREGAWNRGCREGEEVGDRAAEAVVRVARFFLEGGALRDAEAVLFVHDDESEVLE